MHRTRTEDGLTPAAPIIQVRIDVRPGLLDPAQPARIRAALAPLGLPVSVHVHPAPPTAPDDIWLFTVRIEAPLVVWFQALDELRARTTDAAVLLQHVVARGWPVLPAGTPDLDVCELTLELTHVSARIEQRTVIRLPPDLPPEAYQALIQLPVESLPRFGLLDFDRRRATWQGVIPQGHLPQWEHWWFDPDTRAWLRWQRESTA